MNVVDSSGWLEYFANEPNASFFASPIENVEQLVVPSLTLYEVFKRVLQQRNEGDALRAVAAMQQGLVVDLTPALALAAARVGVRHKLALADSVVLTTAQAHGATLWTQDADFEGITGVRYLPKKRSGPTMR